MKTFIEFLTEMTHWQFPDRYAFDASKPRYGYTDSTNTADLKKAEAENRFNVRSEQWISW